MGSEGQGAMMEKPSSGVDSAMSRMECEVGEIDRMVGNLIDRLHSVLVPEGSEAPMPAGNVTAQAEPSAVTNHLNAMTMQLTALSSRVRRALDRLDV